MGSSRSGPGEASGAALPPAPVEMWSRRGIELQTWIRASERTRTRTASTPADSGGLDLWSLGLASGVWPGKSYPMRRPG
jgi:hypothetical protein